MVPDEIAAEMAAIEEIRTGNNKTWGEAAALLARGSGDEVDEALLDLFEESCDRTPKPGLKVREIMRLEDRAELISRILAERDPDRDPSYVDWLLGEEDPDDKRTWTIAIGAENWGFTRLRQLEPVRRCTELLQTGGRFTRGAAVLCLGDTVDAAAFEPLLTALSDRSKYVRTMAVMSVRRLAQSGFAEEYAGHAVRARLGEMLRSDRKWLVRLQLAPALCVLGDEALVAEALRKAWWWERKWKRKLREWLNGEIEPLLKMWDGER